MFNGMVLRQARFLLKIGDTMRVLSCSLLAWSTLLVGCGMISDSTDAAVEAITKMGGTVTFDEEKSGKPLGVDLSEPHVLFVLNLPQQGVTDARLEHLKGLTSLQSLNLSATGVTDAGLVHLKGLTSLQELNPSTHVTDAGLVHLKGLKSLEMLHLDYVRVGSAGLQDLQSAVPKCRFAP
jgi:hypothetical protein